MFYKQVLFIMPIFWLGFYNGYSSLPLYNSYMYQVYNIVFTCVPIIWFAVFDFEFEKEKFLNFPSHYEIGIQNIWFGKYVFIWWIIYGLWQSLVLFFVSFVSYETNGGSFYLEGNFVYTGVVIVANIKILSDTSNHTFFSFLWILGSIFVYIASDLVAANIPQSDLFGVIGQMINS